MVTLKLIYLIALAIVLFIPRDPILLLVLLGAHVLLWLGSGLSAAAMWHAVRRLRWFLLIIFLSYAFISTPASNWYPIAIGPIAFKVNIAGLQIAVIMCARVLTLVLASAWVRQSSPPGSFVKSLRQIGIPQTVAVGVDATLDLVTSRKPGSGQGGGMGGGKGRKSKDPEKSMTLLALRQGKLDQFTGLIDKKFSNARAHIAQQHPDLPQQRVHDITVVLTVGLVVMGLKVLQVMPGLPVAPGHKNILIVPLLLFAARATHMKLGATAAGLTTGIVSFLLGYGKFGILEISHFVVPGLLADLLMPLARASSRTGQILQYAVIGTLLGVGRFAANFLVIVLAGAPWTAFIIYLPMLFSQAGFGALSCLVSPIVVNRAAKLASEKTASVNIDDNQKSRESPK